MDLAQCTLDAHVYTAAEFSQFPLEKRQELRRYLICHACEREAYFRSASRDGKKACFYSWKHLDGCRERHVSDVTSHEERENLEVVNVIIKDSEIIVLDLSQTEISDASTAHASQYDERNSYGNPSKLHILQPANPRMHKCSLATLLKYLITSESFTKSDLLIDTGFPHKRKIKDFFVQFKDIEDCHIGQWRAYWGMITDADPSIEYLNSEGRNAASIVLKTDIRQGIMNRYGTDNSEDFARCYALALGRLKKSARGKKCIYPHGIQ